MKYEIVTLVNNEIRLDVNVSPSEDTIWLSLADMCLLFSRDKSVISRHIKNVILENNLDVNQVVAKNATTELSCNSPLSKTFFIWREIVDLFR